MNWCPALGTVLANEEVVDGVSERGGHPVVRMPLTQWMLRITAYGERLVDDLEDLDWTRAIKDMQRNWVGRSEGAEVDFAVEGADPIRVFTTRPDTLFGATYIVLAPEHSLVDRVTTEAQRAAVAAYREQAARKSDLDRTDLAKTKTGVFTGGHAVNPVNGERIPIWIADYVLMGYGTGAIMAVPGHDERDFEFAKTFNLPILRVVAAKLEDATSPLDVAESAEGVAVNSANPEISLDGLPTQEAKRKITDWLASRGLGKKAINYKLRDWLFSRQRYWGEPFPVLLDKDDRIVPIAESDLPVLLPELEDFKPTGRPEGPLSKATEWVRYSETYRREINTMPQWAGSCWYYLRYIDPKNAERAWDPEKEKYWMPVDLYVGGAEHAVLHLLYSRFWHKVLFDRGLVSTPEPFQRLINQGMILGEVEYFVDFVDPSNVTTKFDSNNLEIKKLIRFVDSENRHFISHSDTYTKEFRSYFPLGNLELPLPQDQVEIRVNKVFWKEHPDIEISGSAQKMSKSRGNVINPDVVVRDYGADSLRLYEMFMGPLEAVKPWSMKGVEGVYRFLGRAWRMIVDTDSDVIELDPKVQDVELSREQAKVVARTVAAVTENLDGIRFNSAISRLMEFVNFFTGQETRPKQAMETFSLLLSPLAPHLAEELWELLGHSTTLAFEPWPTFDESLLKDDEIELPVQINGKLRARVMMPADADQGRMENLARSDARIAPLLEGKTVRKVVVVPGKMVNFVVG